MKGIFQKRKEILNNPIIKRLFSFKTQKINLIGKTFPKYSQKLPSVYYKQMSNKNNNNKIEDDDILDNITIDESKTIDDFVSNPLSETVQVEKESKTEEEAKEQEKNEKLSLIYYLHPIVPHATITIDNPNRNDLFFSFAIKFGKVTPIDDETTVIEDIAIYSEREESLGSEKKEKLNILNKNYLGTMCKITYNNKDKLEIEGQDKMYKIQTIRPGKHKFFNPKETKEIETNFIHSEEYLAEVKSLFDSILVNHEYILDHLKIEPSYFGDHAISFNFDLNKIKSFLNKADDNTATNITNDEYYKELIKFGYYFILKSNTLHNLIYGSNTDYTKYMYISDLKTRLDKLNDQFEAMTKFLKLKYDDYKFLKSIKFNFDNPFANETEDDKNRILKYKEAVENKMSDMDTIEKQKEEYRKKIADLKSMPDDIKKLLEKEISRISNTQMETENTKRTEYLQHIVQLPWDNVDEPVWDIEHARKVLDGNLYGLNETKERIYEFIAKNTRKNNKKGCVILLTGGPGTGKTRIAKLIGEALNRKVGFVSLAGVSDGKTILGFKRTYVSSTPGVLIKEMQKVGTKNPVLVIDEIDKVNLRSTHSNVYHAILQILNPEENHRFIDHYLEIPFDFSNVIFILTSNSEKIFAPLMDRMEVIRVDPYVTYEKFLILKKYAKQQILEDYHFNEQTFQITDKALYKLIHEYCNREAGIRKAKKLLESVIRKVNSKIELGEMKELEYNNLIQINSENILKIINEPKQEDPILTEMILNSPQRHGFCTGLTASRTDQSNSWGSASIFSLSMREIKKVHDHSKTKKIEDNNLEVSSNLEKDIEVNNEEGDDKKSKKLKLKSEKFKLTSSGNLGEDLLQSVSIALNVATEFLSVVDPINCDFFNKHELHFDCPEIVIHKSGPSAGCVIFLCAMSLALKKPLIPNLALTGEVCIDGSVLKIGGVKEKAQGAQRYGVKTLVLPIGNKYDFMELPDNLRNSFEKVYFAENCWQVYNIGFGKDTKNIQSYVPEKYIGDVNSLLEEENLMQNNVVDKLF